MKFLVTVLVAAIGWGCSVEATCKFPPSLWCSSGEIAKQCGVYDQCSQYLHKDTDAGPVDFTLYFESLCPDCRDFFNKQLYRAWMMLGKDVINITLVPYGNARESQSEGKWVFECQHGKQECLGNLVETCGIHLIKNISVYFPFVACIEKLEGLPITNAKSCAKEKGIDIEPILDCVKSDLGNALEHEMAMKTNALQPPHKYVPWILINGVHTEDIQKEAEEDLVKLICKTYKGPTPKNCKTLLMDSNRRSYL